MRTKLFAGVAFAALLIPASAYAQSTGSADFEGETEIVVTGSRADQGVAGVRIPDSPKAKIVVDQTLIARSVPGQTINEILNQVPGVSFTNDDPWGGLGGSFTIRGFDSSRISQTFDGLPLNDSGNYAVYTNQQLDPELIDNVNVNLGATDVDSPTASAVGGTVNINSLTPRDQFGVMVSSSFGAITAPGAGDRNMFRVFGLVHTGDITGFGTRAWFSASTQNNDAVFANWGRVNKQQYNAKIRQDIGSNGDFISIAGHYNENRNTFNGSPLGAAAAALVDKRNRFYNIGAPNGGTPANGGGFPCTLSAARPGLADAANNCGTEFERRYNPSNTGNVRFNSRFGLTDKLVFSLDAGYQYVKANGGGTVRSTEAFYTSNTGGLPLTGFFGGTPYFGRDLNGDGDLRDTVTLLSPSQTQTRRYTAVANLAYELNDFNRVRLSYTFDRARHRQTGEVGRVLGFGDPVDVFPVNDPLTDTAGNVLQKRDRKSFAQLHRIAAEYRGEFLDGNLVTLIGGAMPFYQRDLNQYCFTTGSNGFVDCVAGGDASGYVAGRPYVNTAAGRPTGAAPPVSRTYNYKKFLPNVGLTYNLTPAFSVALSYAKNLSVPGTDTLYNSLYVPENNPGAQPDPETSNSVDLSLRYKTSKIQAAVTPWYSEYKNRIVSAYVIECDCSVDTNLGNVKKWGVDANIGYQPIEQISLYAFGSYIKSEIQDNVIGANGAITPTAGKRERNTPEFMYGGSIRGSFMGFDLGAQAKHTTSRFINDINTFRVPGYTVVDLDLRYSLVDDGFKKTYLQLNVQNLFDEFYIGKFSGGLTTASSVNANFGSPRSITGSLVVDF